jgi:ankyrin repeat protein
MHHQLSPSVVDSHFNNNSAFALHVAVGYGDIARMHELLRAGQDINRVDTVTTSPNQFGTPLHIAVWCNQQAAFDSLLVHNPDLNVLDGGIDQHYEDTPLRLAVRLGRHEMVKQLWHAGAQHNKYASDIPVHSHCSLLEVAAYEGHAAIVEDLLSWSTEWTQDQRNVAMRMASQEWHPDVVKVLLERCNYTAEELETYLRSATGHPTLGKPRISKQERFLTLKEDSKRQAAVFELLLDAQSKDGVVVSRDRSELLNRLLLLVSFSTFHIGALRVLLERGADPDVRDAQWGETPLHCAFGRMRELQRSNEEGIALLLQYKARVDILDTNGNSAVDTARNCGEEKMAQLMLQSSSETSTTT